VALERPALGFSSGGDLMGLDLVGLEAEPHDRLCAQLSGESAPKILSLCPFPLPTTSVCAYPVSLSQINK